MKARSQDQDSVHQSINALISCKGSREYAAVLARELGRYVKFDVTGLYLYSPGSETLTCISAEHLDAGSPGYEISQLPAEGSIKQAAARAQRALLCEDIIASDWTEGRTLRKWQKAESCIIAPLVLRSGAGEGASERTIGVLFVGVHRHGALSEQDRRVLENLGAQVAPSLQAVLAIEERDALMAIDQRAVVGSVTMTTLLPRMNDIIQRVIPNDGSALIQVEGGPKNAQMEFVSVDGLSLDLEQFSPLRFSTAMETAEPLLLTGHNHSEYPEIPYLESIGMYSSLVTPLYVKEKHFGFLLIGSRRRNAFSQRDIRLCNYLGHHLSQAISNLSAFAEIQTLKDQIERENRYLREQVRGLDHHKELIGKSTAFLKTMGTIQQIAPTDSTVLIMGETGTGKELVAQTLYEGSPRRDKAFIRVNCATLPEHLIESELFGHEKGAFTHATSRKIGRFELANEGTLFLDEVGELPIGLQAKLLRAIDAQEFDRVGGVQTIQVDVRILAATNVDLERAVTEKQFRADLYYRLKVLPIHIPPLRERQEDIPLIADYFMKRHITRHRKSIKRINDHTIKVLCAYHWPGNIRELNHMIERAVILTQGEELVIEELEEKQIDRSDQSASNTRDQLETVERAHILDILNQCNWVVSGPSGAAKRLGMHRATLQYRMKKLAIEKSDQKAN